MIIPCLSFFLTLFGKQSSLSNFNDNPYNDDDDDDGNNNNNNNNNNNDDDDDDDDNTYKWMSPTRFLP